MKKIFVGGLGRSGTTIGLHALYLHPDVNAIPVETKVLVEEDGFYDLVEAATTRFAPGYSEQAFERFTYLMQVLATGKEPGKFSEQKAVLDHVFHNYHEALNDFIEAVRFRRAVSDRHLLVAMVRKFVEDTFSKFAVDGGKSHWAEKTPANIWRVEFLRELFPDCYIVHMIRNPLDTYYSAGEKGWLSPDRVGSIINFEGYCHALSILRGRYANDPRYIEVKMEELLARPRETLQTLASRLGIEPYPYYGVADFIDTTSNHQSTNSGRFKSSLSKTDKQLLKHHLGPWAIELGYRVET